ncbi:AMIN domain-containing protein [Anoxybacterium hadale]|uniref:AMIN domain-containing protein n=1 Tax=Anoxybacterium hadale TaxID=3408580 RepID=A0ACD1AAA8_9FIRM|nr:AMIN domain-containing protein [Clostridiales bacterium]
MRRKLRLMFLPLMVILMMGTAVYGENTNISQKDIDEGIAICKEFPVALQIDGKSVNSDVPPVIIKERTLIPLRAVFESMGAQVTWNDQARIAAVALGSSSVQLDIDREAAFVNGNQAAMDVPALIINDRTMIPLRFVAESLNCGIGWDDLTRTVSIQSPVTREFNKITSVKIQEKSDYYRVIIEAENGIEAYNTFVYDNPQRFGVDLKNMALGDGDGEIKENNDLIKTVRYDQFAPETARVVVELKEKVAGKVSFSDNGTKMYIDFDKNQQQNSGDLGDVTIDGLNVVDWRAAKKIVFIDSGHGGSDTGSQAKRDGVEILNEKDVNLDIALRLNRMLKAAGVSTYMLRETDTTVTLYDRPAMANGVNADLYVSVHNNSTDKNPSAKGTETYYYSKTGESDYNIYSKELAELVQKYMVANLGTVDRRVKSEPAYAVLNKTKMPAIIIEGAFLSNTEDLKLMMTDEFRENYALAAARAIIEILNKSVEE